MGPASVEVQQRRVRDRELVQKLPQVVHMASAQRHHGNLSVVEMVAERVGQDRQDRSLRCPLPKHHDRCEVELRMTSHRLDQVLGPRLDLLWQRHGAHCNGFSGELLVEELLWRTPTPQPESWGQHESEPYGFTDLSAAKYYARAIVLHLGLDVGTGLAVVPEDVRPRSHAVIRALSTVMAGTEPSDLPVEIESQATNIEHYGFSLPGGDRLLAVWTDGPALAAAAGTTATLTFPGISTDDIDVIGIDVLHGFEQKLLTQSHDGNLAIRDVLIKDYPTIVRITLP